MHVIKVEITIGFWILFNILSEGSDLILIQREMRRRVQESGHIPPVTQEGTGIIAFISPFCQCPHQTHQGQYHHLVFCCAQKE